MKKPVSFLLVLVLLLSVAVAPVPVGADTGATGDETVYTEGNFQYTVSDGEAAIKKYIGASSKVVVPSVLGGYPVTCVGCVKDDDITAYNEFSANPSFPIRSGFAPTALRVCLSEDGVCEKPSNITSVSIPSSVKTIGVGAFYNCSNLSEVSLGAGVEKIWGLAFYGCTFKELRLPKSINYVAKCAFSHIEKLHMYTDFDFTSDNFPKETVNYIHIFRGSKKIPPKAFRGFTALEEVNFPSTLKEIGDEAFMFCDHLYCSSNGIIPAMGDAEYIWGLDIPSSVEKIGDAAFYGCYSWDGLFDPESSGSGAEPVAPGMEIEYHEHTKGLFYVRLHNGLKHIGAFAFADDEKLAHIQLPHTLEFLGTGAFYNTPKLKCDIGIPKSVDFIFFHTFALSGVRELTICGEKTKISTGAFGYCAEESMGIYEDCIEYYDGTYSIDITLSDEGIYLGCKTSTFFRYYNPYATNPEALQIKSLFEPTTTGTFYGSLSFPATKGATNLKEVTLKSGVTVNGCYPFGTNYEDILVKSISEDHSVAYKDKRYLFKKLDKPEDDRIDYEDDDGVGSTGEGNPMLNDFKTLIGLVNFAGGLSGEGSITDTIFDCFDSELFGGTIPEVLNNKFVRNVAFEAFKDLDIKDLKLPSSLEEVGDWAYSGCKKLGKAALNEGLKEIKDYAFSYCSELVDVDLPESLTELGNSAFEDCSKLKDIEIPDGITELGQSVFSNCKNLKDVKLPKDLKTIGDTAFSACKKLEVIELPDNLTDLKDSVFSDCVKLKDIELPDELKEIGEGAFSGCKNLKNIELPDSLTELKDAAFEYCEKLKKIEVPDGIKSISDYTFNGCKNLKKIELPDGIKTIGESAFSGCESLTNIELPDGATRIGENAFNSCKNLTSISIPASVTDIAANAFKGCTSLKEINVQGVTNIGANAFYNCTSLRTISFPDCLSSIGERAFVNCRSLTSVTIPDNIAKIPEYTFYGCSNLTSVIIPKTVTSIRDDAFEHCSKLTVYGYYDSYARQYCMDPAFRFIPFVGFSVSDNKATVERCVDYEGYYNQIYTDITIPPEFDGYPVTSISNQAFAVSQNLTNIKLPDSLLEIGERAFSGCYRLRAITIPDSVNNIGDNAFYGTSSLTTLTVRGDADFNYDNLPKSSVDYLRISGETIKDESFDDMLMLRGIDISDTVKSIGNKAFKGCTGITYLRIPDSIKSIGNSAFENCSELAEIIIPDSLETIGSNAFSNSGLTNIIIPDSVISLGEAAFSNCSNLSNLTLSNNIKSIGDFTFENCTNLTDLTFLNSVESIGTYAFSGCDGLSSVKFGENIRRIEEYAFNNCSSLKSVEFVANPELIEPDAFSSCTNIKKVFFWSRLLNSESETCIGSEKLFPITATIYGYDSSLADTYAKRFDYTFVPLLKTNTGKGYIDAPLTDTQLIENDGNDFALNKTDYGNIELLCVQSNTDENVTNGLRFVAVINEGLVQEATRNHDIADYGFVLSKCSESKTEALGESNIQKIKIDTVDTVTYSCKNTSNSICGDYGIFDRPTKYKYVTLSVDNFESEQGVVVRFFIKTTSGRVYYANYNTDYTGCAASYNQLVIDEEGENSVLLNNELETLPPFQNGE